MKISTIFLFCLMLSTSLMAQTIAEIQGNGEDSPYTGQSVTTSGIVTAVNSGNGYFIQDGTAIRSGIYVYDQSNSPTVGDAITLTADVVEFYNLTELKDLTAFNVDSQDNPLPAPIEISTGDIENEDYESMLIRIPGANCTNTDLGFGEWELNDGSGPARVDDLMHAFTPDEGVNYIVEGPLYYSFDNYKIVPRSADDVTINIPLYFTKLPLEKNIQTTSLTIEWMTNVPANSSISYGKTPAFELGMANLTDLVTEHSIVLDNLEPATIYYISVLSEVDDEMTPEYTRVVSTGSNSSGDIKVYFNHEVETSVATISPATWTPNITDTIIAYLDLAEETIDFTMYEAQSEDIVAALNAAYDRGVQVRVISDDEGDNEAFGQLNAAIPFLEGNPDGIMHNKFIIIDADSEDASWTITGSTNHTLANLGWDYNNMICIQDQSLARAYRLEFQEMWGSDLAQPDANNARFGSEKTDNTPHIFRINDIPVELYFSPSDAVKNRVEEAIDLAENEMAFAILVFTENALGTAVYNAHERGVTVNGIIDYVEFNGSEYDFLLNNGVNVQDYQNADGSQWPDGPTLHHKYAIIDYAEGSDNPLVITGSYNWTASAGSIHDENTLLIYDAEVANWYWQEFYARFFGLTSTSELARISLELFPNPTSGDLQTTLPEPGQLRLLDTQGRVLWQQDVANEGIQMLDLNGLSGGVYWLQFTGTTQHGVTKVVKQ